MSWRGSTHDAEGDTHYAVDRVSEERLVGFLGPGAGAPRPPSS